MPEDLLKNASSKFIGWILGIIAGLMIAALYGGFKFYTEWKADEAFEDATKYQEKSLMFDSPEQKEEHKDHVKEALPALDQRLKVERDNEFQNKVLEQLKKLAEIDTLNAHQIYQIKEQLKHESP